VGFVVVFPANRLKKIARSQPNSEFPSCFANRWAKAAEDLGAVELNLIVNVRCSGQRLQGGAQLGRMS
jgi:hypothetical protein